MSAKPMVDRKTRTVIWLIVIMVVAIVALAVRSYVAKVGESQIHTGPMVADERLVIVDGRSMLVRPEAVAPTLSHWLSSKEGETMSFELSDRSFVPNAVAPTPMTVERIRQLAQVTRTAPAVAVHIVLPTHFPSAAVQQLDHGRATGVRDELMEEGVSASRVAVESEGGDSKVVNGAEMAIVLTK